ncbi:hypothetical protein V8C40DRAFT_257531 [Trichoderma camerunense]
MSLGIKKRTDDGLNAPKRPSGPYFLYMQHARSTAPNDHFGRPRSTTDNISHVAIKAKQKNNNEFLALPDELSSAYHVLR